MIRAVLTGDIVNSTLLTATTEKKLHKILQQLLEPHLFEFYRGDSFQVYLKEPKEALQLALLCRTAAISLTRDDETASSDIRISIGLGPVAGPVKVLGEAKGDAFILSGRAFDEIAKSPTRLLISTANPLANEALQVIAEYINAIYKSMTGKQAEVIFELLKGETQQAVAHQLRKTKSTISQHAGAGRWTEIEKLMTHYENILNQLI